MIGETRDLETAQIAIQASLTGHLVFTTLHTNDAPGAITRLIDMGVEPFLISSTLEAVLGQRLLRSICRQCRTAYQPNEALLAESGIARRDIGEKQFYYGKGCDACNDTGYKGRKGIYELLKITDPIRELINERAPTVTLKQKAIELGMVTLFMPRYNYVAPGARGQEATGLLEAASTNEAIGELRQAGYFPTSVYQEDKSGPNGKEARRRAAKMARMTRPRAKTSIVLFQRKKIKPKVLMIFTRQLATLIDSGLPLLRSLNVLAKQEPDAVLKNTINKLADAVQGGNTFSDALAFHPRIFNDLYVNMVKAGEVGGVLELVLNRLAEFQEKAAKIKNKVVAAMVYPVIVMTMAVTNHGFSPCLHCAEVRNDLSRHARQQTATGRHPVCDRSEQRHERAWPAFAWRCDCHGGSLQVGRSHAHRPIRDRSF